MTTLLPRDPRAARRARTLGLLGLVTLALLPAGRPRASGVLIPLSHGSEPDPLVLGLRSMDVRASLDDLHLEVRVEQVYENRTDGVVEGKFVFPLGDRAVVKDFAIWEGDERLAAVVVERARGRRLYEELTRQNVDPGLLETGDEEETGLFTLRVAPIPPRGTSRIELVYEEELPIDSLATRLAVPLTAREFEPQVAGALAVRIDVRSSLPIGRAVLEPADWFLGQAPKPGARAFTLTHRGANVTLERDLAAELELAPPAAGVAASLVAYRDVTPRVDRAALSGGSPWADEHGYFLARALFAPSSPAAERPRDVALVVDTSLSMQWDKLQATANALDVFLGQRLRPQDRFGLVLFHDEVRLFRDALVPGTPANAGEASRFFRASPLAGGTDLAGALGAAARLLADAKPRPDAARFIVLVTDGHPTAGEVALRRLEDAAGAALRAAGKPAPRLFVLGVGDDASSAFLGRLAEGGGGALALIPSAGDATFTLRVFFDKLGQGAYAGLAVELPASAGVDLVYPTAGVAFDGGGVAFFGRYRRPQPAATATFRARGEAGPLQATFAAPLVEAEASRPHVARGWASRRIADLLARIRADGEREEWVREIVELARRHKLVTPYTSFLAAPRAMLRPRTFQPGDPVLRVTTGPDVVGVTAIFPFGLVKPLERTEEANTWETRFLAPAWMTDGTYACTLVLEDQGGARAREEKSFVIDSRPPELDVQTGTDLVRGGDRLRVVARADADTRSIRARLAGGPSVEIRWSDAAAASVGELVVPADLPAGAHPVEVVAEDFARNTSSRTVTVTVVRD